MLQGGEGNDTLISSVGHWYDGGADTDTIVYADAASNYRIKESDFSAGNFIIEDLRTGRVDMLQEVELVRFNGINGTNVLLTRRDKPPAGKTFDGTASWGGTITGTAGVDTVTYATANHSVYVDLNRDGGYARAQTGPSRSRTWSRSRTSPARRTASTTCTATPSTTC